MKIEDKKLGSWEAGKEKTAEIHASLARLKKTLDDAMDKAKELYHDNEPLTELEKTVMRRVLEKVKRHAVWDEKLESYIDDGRIVIMLEKNEYQALNSACKKIRN